MAKKSTRKGNSFERKIANKIGEVTGLLLRRVPMSGGLDIRSDIYCPNDPSFEWFIECKHRNDITIWSIFNPDSYIYRTMLKAVKLSKKQFSDKVVTCRQEPCVVFRGKDFLYDLVCLRRIFFEKHFNCSYMCYINNGLFSIILLNDFLKYLENRYNNIKIENEDDGDY